MIRLLPDAIANQIAAGEVVQRPASVVKELLENSLDARATQITLIVKEAGRQLVQVVDDGTGMSETDARMCFERHATSKIRNAEDLWAIRTMGFRGEAMASIAAVARVELKTRLHGEDVGSEICIEGSAIKSIGPVATPAGTSIAVKDLFYNTPARRNFLKSNTAELKHIIDEFTRVALARPDVAMHLIRGEEEFLRLPKGKLAQRIAGLFGKGYTAGLVPLQEAAGAFSLQGYMGKPDLAKKTRGEQFFFVNGRYIRHPFLHHAVMSALEGLLPADFHPFYTIFIQTDPARLDVNVHPTKTEVKFEDERSLYAILFATVRKAMADFHVTPPLDFEGNVNFGLGKPASDEDGLSAADTSPSPSAPPTWLWPTPPTPPVGLDNWRNLPPGQSGGSGGNMGGRDEATGGARYPGGRPDGIELGKTLVGAGGQLFESETGGLVPEIGRPLPRGTFQFGHQYLATAVRSGLMLIDVEAARERILYEKFMRRQGTEGLCQQSIFPVTVELSPSQSVVLEEVWEDVLRLGFDLERMGQHKLQILGSPTEAYAGTEKELLEGLLEQYAHAKDHLKIPRKEQVARALAAKAAKRPGQRELGPAEQESLISRLFTCQVPNITPDGRPVTVLLGLQAVAGWFGKPAQ